MTHANATPPAPEEREPARPPRGGHRQDEQVAVFAPSVLLSVTVEARPLDDAPELHLHAAGQGFWVARMVSALGAPVVLTAPLGGETGRAIPDLVAAEGVRLEAVRVSGSSGSYVQDRRSGEREELFDIPPAVLARHEVDELYGSALGSGLDSRAAVLTGSETGHLVDPSTYTRLAKDLRAQGVEVVADLSGEQLEAVVAGGPSAIKVSHEELVDCGRAASDDVQALHEGMRSLLRDGADAVVCSRAAEPTLLLAGKRLRRVVPPSFEVVDPHGAGDSMTAGIAVALAAGEDIEAAARLGAAAGALNVTRHGLATGHRGQVERLLERVVVEDER